MSEEEKIIKVLRQIAESKTAHVVYLGIRSTSDWCRFAITDIASWDNPDPDMKSAIEERRASVHTALARAIGSPGLNAVKLDGIGADIWCGRASDMISSHLKQSTPDLQPSFSSKRAKLDEDIEMEI